MKYIGNIGPKLDINLFYLDFDTNKISKEVLSVGNQKLNNNPLSSNHEDTYLNPLQGSETEKLIESIKNQFSSTYILESYWSHIHKPLESTNTHNHQGSDISFAYYVKVPKDSGMFVVDLGPSINGPRIPIPPIEGSLIVFPAWMPHLVTKNLSNDIRISISGNLRLKT
tara:strand:+ start:201 stop:707 length:507 start_codon:yes stop_codon:yes gene_type:complete